MISVGHKKCVSEKQKTLCTTYIQERRVTGVTQDNTPPFTAVVAHRVVRKLKFLQLKNVVARGALSYATYSYQNNQELAPKSVANRSLPPGGAHDYNIIKPHYPFPDHELRTVPRRWEGVFTHGARYTPAEVAFRMTVR